MLKGLNEKLEQTLDHFGKNRKDTDWADVMMAITYSVAIGDIWQVPVETIPEGMNETDFEDGQVLGKIPILLKKTVSVNDKEMYCAFTSSEKVRAGDCGDPVMTVAYPARLVLDEICREENFDGLMLNPWSDEFVLQNEDIRKVLMNAEKIPEEVLRNMQVYQPEPVAVIDVNEILEEWRSGWDDQNDNEEKWKLVCYPIMADGRILLLFEMKDELYTGNDPSEKTHRFSHFRVLEYQMENGKLEQIGKYRFKTQDAHVSTVYLYNGKLNVAICPLHGEKYSILPIIPTNDEGQFGIYENVRTMITDSRQNVIVAYEKNLLDQSRIPLIIYDENGTNINRYHDDYALACQGIALDRDENIWFHMFPSSTVDMLDLAEREVKSYGVELQGFDTMAFNDDLSKMFVVFSEYRGGIASYVMTRDENGNYVKPIRFEFLPETADGSKKDIRNYGYPSAMKSWVLLYADGKLYLYDINDC